MKLTEEHRLELMRKAADIRERTVELIFHGNGGHIGGDLSEVDILVAIYDYMKHDPKNPDWDGRDYFVLSKGHSAEAYYTVLNDHGYISDKDMDEFGSFGALLGGHPNRKAKGVEANTGSLGHGLGMGCGIGLGLKMDGKDNRVFVLTGDGELAEGSNWEAAMAIAKFGLKNLTWIIDRNGLQISGNTEDVMPLEDLKAKTEAFGFHTVVINGHEMSEIYEAISTVDDTKPTCVIAKTTKGKGLSCAENQAGWHHKTPTAEQVELLHRETEALRKELG